MRPPRLGIMVLWPEMQTSCAKTSVSGPKPVMPVRGLGYSPRNGIPSAKHLIIGTGSKGQLLLNCRGNGSDLFVDWTFAVPLGAF